MSSSTHTHPLPEAEYAAQLSTLNTRYDEKLRQCRVSFQAFKTAHAHGVGDIAAGLRRMTQLNFKEDAEVLKIELDREEELRELQKKYGYAEHPGRVSEVGPAGKASSRAVAVGALAAIARGLARPEDHMTRQEIDRWVAKFEAANG